MNDYAAIEEGPGSMVGRYKLLQKIGEGGCGIVYMAEQEEPVRRRVALKIIKLGMDTRQVVARFEAERQALAMMDHPNIARVFDAGATETGRPYFVMELVRGIRITDYCDQNHLSTRERLDLFIKTAHAIQHAHQKGIIHRDIKPSNVLVTLHDGVPVPKVIDFGIAKATEQKLTDKTLFTQFDQFIGTPAYTSPEQAEMSGLDIDTRSDIYSLGVLLYELLVGRTPFDQKELLAAGLDEMRRTIREVDPVKPSTRLTQLHSACTVGKHSAKSSILSRAERDRPANGRPKGRTGKCVNLKSSIDHDLDWIVMKCLEKDRTRRYETANGLAADIRHYLGNEPVTARPPGSFYKFGKLVRRKKLASAAVAAVAMTLIVGLIVSLGHASRARHAQQIAKTDGDSARAVMDFFRHQVLAPFRIGDVRSAGGGQDVGTMRRKAIETAESKIAGAFKNRPQVEADIRSTLGASYSHVGEHALAARQHEAALTLFERIHGPSHRRTLESMRDLEKACTSSGDHKRAVALRESRYREELKNDPTAPSSQRELGLLLMESVTSNEDFNNPSPDDAARFKEAEKLLADYLAGVRKRDAGDPERLEADLFEVAERLYRIQCFAMSEPLHRELLKSKHARLKPGDSELLDYTASMARLLSDWAWAERNAKSETGIPKPEIAARAREAEELLRQCLLIPWGGSDAESWRITERKGRLGSALVSVAVTDPALNAEARLAKLYEAEPLLLEVHGQLPQKGFEPKYQRDARVRLVRLYEAWDKPDKRDEWQRKLDEFDGKKSKPSSATAGSQ
jgi:serine/threonine protein kinase